MDKYVGDLHSMIVDRELEIIQDLLEKVIEYSETMMEACDVCAELDVLLAMAQASRMNGYVRPEMVDENIIEIVRGRYNYDFLQSLSYFELRRRTQAPAP
jgi:DNA mismatch repair protein MSH5